MTPRGIGRNITTPATTLLAADQTVLVSTAALSSIKFGLYAKGDPPQGQSFLAKSNGSARRKRPLNLD